MMRHFLTFMTLMTLRFDRCIFGIRLMFRCCFWRLTFRGLEIFVLCQAGCEVKFLLTISLLFSQLNVTFQFIKVGIWPPWWHNWWWVVSWDWGLIIIISGPCEEWVDRSLDLFSLCDLLSHLGDCRFSVEDFSRVISDLCGFMVVDFHVAEVDVADDRAQLFWLSFETFTKFFKCIFDCFIFNCEGYII